MRDETKRAICKLVAFGSIVAIAWICSWLGEETAASIATGLSILFVLAS
jgi:hypothetical protein